MLVFLELRSRCYAIFEYLKTLNPSEVALKYIWKESYIFYILHSNALFLCVFSVFMPIIPASFKLNLAIVIFTILDVVVLVVT